MTNNNRMEIRERPPSLIPLEVESGDGKVFGMILSPGGKRTHRVVLILHGFPGHEKNMDLAHELKRRGFLVVAFNYRGAWGSPGIFTFSNMLEDVGNVLGHIRSDGFREEFHTSPEGEILIGHSMGGWAALVVTAGDTSVDGVCSMAGYNLGSLAGFARESELNRRIVIEGFRNQMTVLRGPEPEILMEQVIERGEEWDLTSLPKKLRKKEIFLIGAEDDETAFPELHYKPVLSSFKDRLGDGLCYSSIPGDHNFSGNRLRLCSEVSGWASDRFGDIGGK